MTPRRKTVAALTAEKVAFLSDPASYPESSRRVEVVQSHMSWVFLTDSEAYKLKKPVRYDFLDFSTLAARHADCRAEIRLNRRLAAETYCGVVALVRGGDGRLALGGPGEVVDWLVRMRRLSHDRMLDRMIAAGTVERADIREAALRLAGFYRGQPPVRIGRTRYLARFRDDVTENRRELAKPRFAMPRREVDGIGERLSAFLEEGRELLLARRAEGRIINAHGDLRPEHVWLGRPAQIIDCLEFKRAFRLLDPAEELSFLAIECEQQGSPWVGQAFLDICRPVLGDPSPSLLAFYAGYRAFLRAKITIWHLKDRSVRTPAKWPRLARSYLRIAARHARRLDSLSLLPE